MTLPLPVFVRQAIPSNWRSSLQGALYPDGLFRVQIPGVLRNIPEIGYYVHQFEPARAREFSALLLAQKLWDIPGLKMLRPDEPVASVTMGEGEQRQRRTWRMSDLPSEILPVLDAFNRLVDEARASPVQVLAGTARLADTRSTGRARLSFEFSLRNAGTESIVFPNPMTSPPGVTRLRLLVARPSPGPGKPAFGQQRFDIPPTSLFYPDRPGFQKSGTDELLDLAPGQTVRFAGEPVLYLSPGQHLTALSFDSSHDSEAPPNALEGVLTMEMQTLQVVHET